MQAGAIGERMLTHGTKRPWCKAPPHRAQIAWQPHAARHNQAHTLLTERYIFLQLGIVRLARAFTGGIVAKSAGDAAWQPKTAACDQTARMLGTVLSLSELDVLH